ncbi:MAG: zeta toxin family protein [Candidatus Kapabacteria bacterium]|nr:zeta toxin family protein [Candidatus Kapabacteria bacterium]
MNKLYIIAGPNGAGKTTASMEYLKDELYCLEFVNADNIASGISPFRPENVAVSAGKIMIERINELIHQKVDFAIEKTLSSKTLLSKISMAKVNDFEIYLLFYWLDSPELAIKRVENRVKKGGHSIPEDVIIRRYFRGLDNLFNIYLNECNYWLLINNSGFETSIIAECEDNILNVYNPFIWNNLKDSYDKRK